MDQLTQVERAALEALSADLRRIFGVRLHSLVAYGLAARRAAGAPLHTLALVERVTFEDLAVCVPSTDRWLKLGLEVPLLISRHEFRRTLDVFPLEYGDIITNHVLVEGTDPFEGATVAESDERRACELQAKSHLIHLREGFLESGGDPGEVSRLIAASASAFRTLLTHIARLERRIDGHHDAGDDALAAAAEQTMGVPASLVSEVLSAPVAATTIADPTALLARYIDAAEKVWAHVDGWGRV
jgi:hypothetical protein